MRNYLILVAFFGVFVGVAEGQVEWGQFRGPGGAGIAAEGQALPVEFDKGTNVIWRCEVPKGHSSPCIWGDRIFLTSYAARKLETICVDRLDGEILWRSSVWAREVERVHQISNQAAPTAVTDGEQVIVYFGSFGLVCYDFEGRMLWAKPMVLPRNMYGTSASPILAGGKLIIMDDPGEDSIVLALDPATGAELWKMDQPGFKAGWSTPVYRKAGDVEEVIIYGKWRVAAFDLKDGKELWTVPGMTDEPCITPVMGEGFVFVSSYNMRDNPEVIGLPTWSELIKDLDKDKSGDLSLEESRANKSILSRFDSDGEGDHPLWGMIRAYNLDEDRSGGITEKEWGKMVAFIDSLDFANALMAIKPAGKGQDEAEVVWKHTFGVPECPSPLYYQGRVYMVKSGGIVSCLDAKTGEKKYQEMLDSGGPYYSSPVVGDGKIYVGSTRGVITVFEPGDELKVLAAQLGIIRGMLLAASAVDLTFPFESFWTSFDMDTGEVDFSAVPALFAGDFLELRDEADALYVDTRAQFVESLRLHSQAVDRIRLRTGSGFFLDPSNDLLFPPDSGLLWQDVQASLGFQAILTERMADSIENMTEMPVPINGYDFPNGPVEFFAEYAIEANWPDS